jgi:hypothetical protein
MSEIYISLKSYRGERGYSFSFCYSSPAFKRPPATTTSASNSYKPKIRERNMKGFKSIIFFIFINSFVRSFLLAKNRYVIRPIYNDFISEAMQSRIDKGILSIGDLDRLYKPSKRELESLGKVQKKGTTFQPILYRHINIFS